MGEFIPDNRATFTQIDVPESDPFQRVVDKFNGIIELQKEGADIVQGIFPVLTQILDRLTELESRIEDLENDE